MSNTPEICPDCKQKHDEVFMEDTEGGGVKIAVGGLKSASRYLRGLAGHCACWMKEVLCLRRQLATRTIERDDLKVKVEQLRHVAGLIWFDIDGDPAAMRFHDPRALQMLAGVVKETTP